MVENPRQAIDLNRLYGQGSWPAFQIGKDSYRSFRRAMAVAEFISQNGSPEDANFKKALLQVSPEQWSYALRQHAFHDTFERLGGLELCAQAFGNAVVDLGSDAGHLAAIALSEGWRSTAYRDARRRSSGRLLAAAALHSNFIDVARGLLSSVSRNPSVARRGLQRVIGNNEAHHTLLKDLRNFQLHYKIVEPDISLRSDENGRAHRLYLDVTMLLTSGYNWKAGAKSVFVQLKTDELEVAPLLEMIARNLDAQVEFFFRAISRTNSDAFNQYIRYMDVYQEQRAALANGMRHSPPFKARWRNKTSAYRKRDLR
jgi:hypothetical protein